MLCPWRTKIYVLNGEERTAAKTDFLPCYKDECPFFIKQKNIWIDVRNETHEETKEICTRTDNKC